MPWADRISERLSLKPEGYLRERISFGRIFTNALFVAWMTIGEERVFLG
jgi:hypothetical protein